MKYKPLSQRERKNKIYFNIEGKRKEEEKSYEVCSFFGCGKKLRLEETLAGSRCCKHSGE